MRDQIIGETEMSLQIFRQRANIEQIKLLSVIRLLLKLLDRDLGDRIIRILHIGRLLGFLVTRQEQCDPPDERENNVSSQTVPTPGRS